MTELTTILLGMSPILESRGAIPIAVGVFGFPIFKAFILSVIGTLIPIAPLLFFWYYLADFLMGKFYFFNRFLIWLFNYTRDKHQHHFNYHHHHHWRGLLEFFALFIFVAIPVPFTGIWTGTVAAFVFGVPFRRALLAIVSGALVSGLIVSLVVQGIVALPLFS